MTRPLHGRRRRSARRAGTIAFGIGVLGRGTVASAEVRAVAVDSLVERFIARVGIRPGEIIRDSHTEQPLVIRKGDLVDIHCISGSIHMKIVARALEPAKEGQTVRFQATDSKRTLSARADGPRRAVADVTECPAQAPSEEASAAGRRSACREEPIDARQRYAKLRRPADCTGPRNNFARETKPGVTPR